MQKLGVRRAAWRFVGLKFELKCKFQHVRVSIICSENKRRRRNLNQLTDSIEDGSSPSYTSASLVMVRSVHVVREE